MYKRIEIWINRVRSSSKRTVLNWLTPNAILSWSGSNWIGQRAWKLWAWARIHVSDHAQKVTKNNKSHLWVFTLTPQEYLDGIESVGPRFGGGRYCICTTRPFFLSNWKWAEILFFIGVGISGHYYINGTFSTCILEFGVTGVLFIY